ncbi:hypothetical protein D9611_006228 [Ephemerocybe angulata]|uniref:Uncharacterized protein n=1 Tax=Ephemerocybe angulata TaxID=980116 RepID=A0A8H5C8H3_9AGAR|nr:hypothetical protein D9611_006228 [Tulosesus angulatus]
MLPLELWIHICSFACTGDDGTTGRSLSFVSHTIRTASEDFRLRTIAVRGELQIARFAQYLESIDVKRRKVENLYITTWAPGSRRSSDYGGYASAQSEQALIDLYRPGICDRTPGPEPEDILEDREELLCHAISRILRAVAETVLIAHIKLDAYRDFIFFPVKFERLEELTILGAFECSYKAYIPHLPANPTLRRLKLNYVALYHDTTLLDSIAAWAPNLTHLYFQLSNPYQRGVVEQLQKILCPQKTTDQRPGQFPMSLKMLQLHPGQKSPPGMCGTGYATIALAKRDLYNYCISEPRIVLRNHPPFLYRSTHSAAEEREAMDEWMDRVEGGLGCWDDSDRMKSPFTP